MSEIAMSFRENPGRKREYSTANGLARYVRRRFAHKTIPTIMALWGLTEGEAKGVVYATASKTAIDKIKQHKNGGWRVMLEVDALVIGETLEEWIEREHQRIKNDRASIEAQDHQLAETSDRIRAALRSMGSERNR